MTPLDLLNATLYVDKGYLADLYEVISGESPSTVITKNQGKKAGGSLPIFSAEVSAQESRTFPFSTLSMLRTSLTTLQSGPNLDPGSFEPGMPSQYGWLEGKLSVFKTQGTVTRLETGRKEVLSEGEYFRLHDDKGLNIALITAPEYFSLSLNTFLKMQHHMLNEMSLPARAYVRVMAARSVAKQWIAVPLLILEQRG